MRRHVLAVFIPPLAVCRYGCAGCCAAPIGVFWISSIISIVYGYRGGPLGLDTVSWGTVGLGMLLWLIAVGWAFLTLRAADDDRCKRPSSSLCRRIVPRADEPDPLDEADRARQA
ncbi:MAG TPA: hypothetical protein ENN42_09095 [Thioalkalivibrio sp.]|nr:hypothetical protein [Thioalkalivibrio sp.]